MVVLILDLLRPWGSCCLVDPGVSEAPPRTFFRFGILGELEIQLMTYEPCTEGIASIESRASIVGQPSLHLC